MTDLAARCEAAEGPDRDLDNRIALIIGWERETGYHLPWHAPKEPTSWRHAGVPQFTASVDAALTLVPEGWGLHMLYEPRAAKGQEAVVWPPGEAMPTSAAKTLPLAICAAALKARDSVTPDISACK